MVAVFGSVENPSLRRGGRCFGSVENSSLRGGGRCFW